MENSSSKNAAADLSARMIGIAASIVGLVVLSCVCAWLVGLLWGVVNFLQTYGTSNPALPFPYFDPTPTPVQPFRNYIPGTFPGMVEDAINWNNAYFKGATRFGSGLGFVIGSLVAVAAFPLKHAKDRLPVAILAGFFIGARSMLMIASAPISAVIGGIVCAIIAALLMLVHIHDSRVATLPRIQFEPPL